MAGFEENEISAKSSGGTEMVKRAIAARMPEGLADDFQVICSRVRNIQEDKIRVYWLHDLPQDPETNHLKDQASRDRFHKLVFCGNWQYNQYLNTLGIPPTEQCAVIDTPIEPIQYKEKSKDEVRLIYTSTPQRGLALLVPVFTELAKYRKNIHLDVFSSFSIYGWGNADEQYRQLFDICKNHPQITYHGFAPNERVREAQQQAHIFAYPSIWQECNSRALIEAMSAGALCLHPNLAGLSDTCGSLTSMYQFEQDHNVHANKFYHLLDRAISIVHEDDTQNYLRYVKTYADNRFNIVKIAKQWEDMLTALKAQYHTVESRGLPKQMFRYKIG
ncbi:Glycosyl transferase, family 1 [uncultured Caudovirales phage]|uniref:Glycosyl transferase, family 1 n=1 Tax=uncultured Caudovirales phage TaxID=2100421 RepID=A0A6J5MAR6_9CAUD|nr:Glycosyl transferase, family 1 [uncultured Caudovirales phage]